MVEVDLDDTDLAWLENSDFIPVPEVPYRSNRDFFSSSIASHDSLARESIARVEESKLKQIERGDSDPIARALALCYQGQFSSAFRVTDENFDKFKSHPSYWNAIGTCYFLDGKTSKALLYYNRARELDENYAPAINNIGVIHLRQGLEQRAMQAFKRASEGNRFVVTLSFNLAMLYLKNGFTDQSKEIFRSIQQSHQGDVDVLNGLAHSYLLSGDPRQAAAYFSQIPRAHHSKPEIGLNFAVALKMIGRDRDAETIFTQVNRNRLGAMNDYYFDVEEYVRK